MMSAVHKQHIRVYMYPHTHKNKRSIFYRVCFHLSAHTQNLCVSHTLMEGVRCVRLGVTDVGESVKSGRVGDLKGSQKAPNWTSETGGADVDDGEDNLPQ